VLCGAPSGSFGIISVLSRLVAVLMSCIHSIIATHAARSTRSLRLSFNESHSSWRGCYIGLIILSSRTRVKPNLLKCGASRSKLFCFLWVDERIQQRIAYLAEFYTPIFWHANCTLVKPQFRRNPGIERPKQKHLLKCAPDFGFTLDKGVLQEAFDRPLSIEPLLP
jgi:hypothetical protein